MGHFRILYGLAMALMAYAVFVLWVWTGPVGIVVAAVTTHALLRVCERQKDAEVALARKEREESLRTAFDR